MHDNHRPTQMPDAIACSSEAAPSRGIATRLVYCREVEELEVVRLCEPGLDGHVREIVSSGSDWQGRRGRRPQPRLAGDRPRTGNGASSQTQRPLR